jgi:hypothetical protein
LNRYSPETLARIQNNAQAWDNWKNSGNNFDERLTNTLTSGDSAVGEWLQGNRQSGVLNRLRNIGGTLGDTSADYGDWGEPNKVTTQKLSNVLDEDGAAYAPKSTVKKFIEQNRQFVLDNQDDFDPDYIYEALGDYEIMLDDINSMKGDYVYIENNPMAASGLHILDKPFAQSAFKSLDADAQPRVLGKSTNETPTTAGGWLKKAGARVVDDINNRGVGLSVKDVNNVQEAEVLPRDIRNMQVNNNTAENPATELYRTVTGETEAPRTTDTDLMYGESELGNRTRRGMLADSLERFGNTLEGAQTNVTRAAAKDLGIESTGKVVENVRKKTGLTNLETQAAFAKELTGDVNSLMDRIQKNALTASEEDRQSHWNEVGHDFYLWTLDLGRDFSAISSRLEEIAVLL